jgi:hypothetical protein
MVIRSPERERELHTGWEAKTEEVQADPMLALSEERRANPVAIALTALFGLVVVVTLFYGLNRDPGPPNTSVSSSTESAPATPPSTSGSAAPSTDANAQSPADKAGTAKHGTGSGQSSATPQPANQGQADRPGRSGENR